MVKKSLQSDNESYEPCRQSPQKSKSLTRNNQNSSKNLLKNICMPLIEFLEERRLHIVLTDLNISKEEILVKNSVSAQIIHKILTNDLVKSINKHDLYKYIYVKISCNSKVTKKPFHLNVMQELLRLSDKQQFAQFKRFKACLSKIKKKMSKKIKKNQAIFQHGSLIQYALGLFYHHFKNQPFQDRSTSIKGRPIQKMKLQKKTLQLTQISNNNKKEFNNERLKPLLKKIVSLLNNLTYNKQQIQIQYNSLSKQLQLEQESLKEKYPLFNRYILSGFNKNVVDNCLQLISSAKKLTVIYLQKLVKNYFSSIFCNLQQKIQSTHVKSLRTEIPQQSANQQKRTIFTPVILIKSQQNLNQNPLTQVRKDIGKQI